MFDLIEFKVWGKGWEDGHLPNGHSNKYEVSGSIKGKVG